MSISKSQFARNRNVSPGRVTQWITAGKIFGPALDGEGRGARINEAIAVEQLGQRLDIDQRHSGNGLRTNLQPVLSAAPTAPTAATPGPTSPPAESVESRIAQERLMALQYANRERAKADEVTNGRLCDVGEARTATVQQLAKLLNEVEGALPEIASKLASRFGVPQRDIVHALKGAWREVRHAAAIEARERAEPLPEKVSYDLAATDDEKPDQHDGDDSETKH